MQISIFKKSKTCVWYYRDEKTALLFAAGLPTGYKEISKLLINANADLNTQDKWDICLMLKIWNDCSYGCC